MQNLGIDTDSLIIVPGEATPTAFVLTNDNEDQISYFYWGAAREFAESKVPTAAIKNAEAIHLATGDPNFNWKCSEEAKNEECNKAINRIFNRIDIEKINSFIDEISCISNIRKEFYKK